jgi:hypothetical protein
MKTKKVLKKLMLNKNTIAQLGNLNLYRVKGGIATFTQPEWFTCDLPVCLTLPEICGNTNGCPNTSGEPYCHLCDETDPISGC